MSNISVWILIYMKISKFVNINFFMKNKYLNLIARNTRVI